MDILNRKKNNYKIYRNGKKKNGNSKTGWWKSKITAMLRKKDGEEVEAFGVKRKMTKLLRKRLNFAKTLMGMK